LKWIKKVSITSLLAGSAVPGFGGYIIILDLPMSRKLISTTENRTREGESESFVYENTTVIWIEGERIFTATLQRPDFILDELHGDPIPEEGLYEKWVEGMLEAPNPLPTNAYVKKPPLERYEPGNSFPWMTSEAKMYEKLRSFAHPNICEYFGAIRQGEYCTALALRKYPITLGAAVAEGRALDRHMIFVGILEGIKVSIKCCASVMETNSFEKFFSSFTLRAWCTMIFTQEISCLMMKGPPLS
jgi:hypothetical protein